MKHSIIQRHTSLRAEMKAVARGEKSAPQEAGDTPFDSVDAWNHSRIGSSLDDFLKEEGIYEETQARAIKEVVVWQQKKSAGKRLLKLRDTDKGCQHLNLRP
ncbi:MAG: hypothetical protein WB870_12850 [Gallionellaceae bacterium]